MSYLVKARFHKKRVEGLLGIFNYNFSIFNSSRHLSKANLNLASEIFNYKFSIFNLSKCLIQFPIILVTDFADDLQVIIVPQRRNLLCFDTFLDSTVRFVDMKAVIEAAIF